MWSRFLTAACSIAAALQFVSQGAPSAYADEPAERFTTGTTAVVVDVVVRDRGGRPVTDLKARDFELYEDGVRQEIASVALVAPGRESGGGSLAEPADSPRVSGSAAATKASRSTVEAPTLVALVFDRLSPEGRALAHRGALAYLDSSHADDFAGVFSVDQSLEIIETFTNDREALRAGIDRVASRASSSFDPAGGRATSVNRGDTRLGVSFTAGAEEHGPPVGATPTNPDPSDRLSGPLAVDQDAPLRVLANRMERSYELMMHEQQGYATATALLAVVDGLAQLPGRKTVVFFAESLMVPANAERAFASVVAAASRANVSIYAIDAAGLRVQSQALQTATQINALGRIGSGDSTRPDTMGVVQDGRGDYAYTKDLELNEDILRRDPAASLGMLANWTGGFLVNNSNDLERAFRRIDEDRRFHYLLTYTPKNDRFGGEYRRLSVRVPKRKVAVRARHGYLALRTPSAIPVLAHEARALAALDASPLPAVLPVRGAAFSFPHVTGQPQVAIVVEAESSALTVEMDRGSGAFATDFTILARVLDGSGRVVRKASQPYRLAIPAGDIQQALGGRVLFFRQPQLAPGDYVLEYAVHDALSGRAGAGRSAFTVFEADNGALRVGSLMIVRDRERVPDDDRQDDNPLFHGDEVLYPAVGSPASVAVGEPVAFAIDAQLARDVPVSISLEVRRGDEVLVERPMITPPPDENGRMRIVDEVPASDLGPGEYTLQLTVTGGTGKEVRSAAFTVVE